MVRILTVFFSMNTLAVFGQIDEIKALLQSKPESEETALWLCDTAFTFYTTDPFTTQQIAELALKKAIEWESDLGSAKANHVIGISHWARDNYELALEYYLKALQYYEKTGLKRGIATINLNIGTIYDDLEESERGISYMHRSIRLVREEKDSINLARAFNNLAVMYGNLHNMDSALHYFEQSMKVRKALKDSTGVAQIYNNISDIYLDREDGDMQLADAQSAYLSLAEALRYIDEEKETNIASLIYINLGKALLELGKYDQAEDFLNRGLKLALKIESRYREEVAYEYLSHLYSKLGDHKKALEYFRKETELDKAQRKADITKQIDRLNIKYETEKKERLLAVLEREKAEERGMRNTIIVASVSVILITVLLLINVHLKRKKDKRITELEMQKLSQEIDKKNKEISSYTLSFIQKNQLMDELKGQISELKKQSDSDTNKQLTRINRIVDETFRADEEWKTFQITFEQMHDGFFATLKEMYPDLGNAELKLCALLRLNMNLKESARVLGISPSSVKTARYRLRKKLGLQTENNLVDFLIRFEKESTVQV